MNILTSLNENANYSTATLQLILGAWVLSTPFERAETISQTNGDVAEDNYRKQSIYSLLYSVYRSVGMVPSESGIPYELTFNTWGYAWPESWGACPTSVDDPQRFGRNAYTGLYSAPATQEYIASREGRVHVVEMGCGTGAGAHHVCSNVLKNCTYEAVDMQRAAIETCRRKFVPELGGRLVATHSDCTMLESRDGKADMVAVCETHVAEMPGYATKEDARFFRAAYRMLKPGGLFVWGNAIPDATWKPCFECLEGTGMKLVEVRDVTKEAVQARDEDKLRVDRYVEHALARFAAFQVPVFGAQKRRQAEIAMKNFYRNPGTKLYENMKDGTDSYKVATFRKES